MKSLIFVFTLVQAVVYLSAAVEKLNYDHLDSGIISVLLKKIRHLEERDREFDIKLKQIDVLRERLDKAQGRVLNMQDLEHRLQQAKEQMQVLVNHVNNKKVIKSATLKVVDTNGTHDTISINSSSHIWFQRAVSNIESRQTEMGRTITELVSFKNRIQTILF
ncbi:hypothetical protein ACJMK2_026554 [Sinanodonta woodiana]|uniref:Uncharacterized protein n=1 Tax=Sinanodonta woodiana TaxID=1069815 RepID=A0ABD3XJZ4_SINWO